ncbi:MAG: NIPSNAP family protein [Chloroflexota bacterium]
MIYEIRTYGITVGSLAEVEKRFGEAYEHRKKYSELAAFWHTEIGPLNEIIHVWPYRDLAERTRVRSEAVKDPNWPPKIAEFIRTQHSEILVPLPFSPLLTPGKLGPIFEMRIYNMRAGALAGMTKAWEAKLPARLRLSPLAVAGHVDLGEANRFIHIWAYTSMQHRAEIRARAVELGVWPPGGGAERLLTQANKIIVPSAFSPLQ